MPLTDEELEQRFSGAYAFGDAQTPDVSASAAPAAPAASAAPATDDPFARFEGAYSFGQSTTEDDYDTGIGYAFMRGIERLASLPDVAQGDYEELAEHNRAMEKWRMSDEDAAKLEEIRNTEGFWNKTGELLMNPRLVLQTVSESLPMMAAPIVGALGGGLAGGAATASPIGAAGGAIVGGGLGSYFTEYYASVGEYFGEHGVDMRDAAQLKRAFQDTTLMAGAREHARKRGVPIAVFDALSMGLAGRIAKPVSKMVGKVTGGRRIGAGYASELGMQAGFGMAGEAGAQISSEGEITDELDVIMEGLAELAPGIVEAGVTGYVDRKAEARKAGVQDPKTSPLAALDQPAPNSPYRAIAETDIDPQTGKPVAIDPMEQLGDQLYEDLGEEGPNTPRPDELETMLNDLGEQLTQDLATQEGIEEAERDAQGKRNMQMVELEQTRDAQIEKQGALEEARKQQEIEQAYRDREIADIEGPEPTESEMVSPEGVPFEGEPVDVSGAQPATEGQILPEGVNPVGGRPLTTSLGEALRGAGIAPPDDDGPSGGGGAPAAPQRGPDASAAEIEAAERLQVEEEDRQFREEDRAEREAIQDEAGPTTVEPDATHADIPFFEEKPKPAVEWADERLADPEAHKGLDQMTGETLKGGGITLVESEEIGETYSHRTKSQNPPWMQSIIAEENVGRKAVLTAVEKAKAGKRLGAKQKRIIKAMLDEWDAPRKYASPEEAEMAGAVDIEPEQTAAPALDQVTPYRVPDKTGRWFWRGQMDGNFAILQKGEQKELVKPADLIVYEDEQVDAFGEGNKTDLAIRERERKQAEKEAKAPAADMNVEGDIFTGTGAASAIAKQDEEQAAAQVDVEEQTGPTLTPRAASSEELDTLADETNDLIEQFAQIGEKNLGMDQSEIVGGISKLKLHDHPRAAEIEAKARAVLTGDTAGGSTPPGDFVIDEDKFNEEGPDTNERVFSEIPPIDTKKRVAIDTKLKREGNKFITPEEAEERISEWEDNALRQGKDSRETSHRGPQAHKDNFNRVIISLFDTTGKWANPYALAGYDVRALDIKDGIDVTDFSVQFMDEMFGNFDGKEIYGIIAACPCTTFSNSSTRWRRSDLPADHPQNRHENADPEYSRKWIEEMWGKKAAEAVDENGDPLYATPHDYAIALVHKTMQTLEYFRPKFWAVENPEGRIEKEAGMPGPWRTGFQPSNFGDPYTKRTLLWGNFNDDLPTANVDPVEGSKMHKMSPSEGRAAQRSETPEGFALAFFQANNYLDTDPLERTKADYWYVEGAVEEAFRAGITEDEFRSKIYLDDSYEPEDIEGTRQAIRDLIEGKGEPPTTPGTPPTTPTTPAPPTTPVPSEADIDAAAAEAVPDEATDAQKEAGNYKKGHLKIGGLDVTIENPVGTVRHGNLKLKDHYGYIKRTVGNDGDQVDVFINSKAQEDWTGDVYIVDQIFPEVGGFDEHKVMFGYNNLMDARRAYKRNFNKDWKGAAAVTKMTLDEFKSWLAEPGANKKPASLSPVTAEGRKALEKHNKDLRYSAGKDLLNAPTNQWIEKVLEGGDVKMGNIPDTVPLNVAVSQLLEMEAQREGAPAAPAKPSHDAIAAAVKPVEERLPGAPVTLLHNYKQAPEPVVKAMEAQNMTHAKAVYDPATGDIFMFSDQIESISEATRTTLHEKTHRGLRVAFGNRLNPLLDDVFKNVSEKRQADMQTIADEYGLDPGKLEDRRTMAEELLTHMAETDPQSGMVKRAVAVIRKILRELGIVEGWTDNDIHALIREAQGAISRNRPTNLKGVTIEEEVIVEGSEEVYVVEQDADVVLTGMNQRIEICKKLRTCL